MQDNLIINTVKDAYVKFLIEEQDIPYPDDDFYDIKKYINSKDIVDHFEKMTLNELKPYILFLAKAYEEGDMSNVDQLDCLDFAQTIIDTEAFADELIYVHFNQLQYYLERSTELGDFNFYDYDDDDELDVETQQKIIAEVQKFENKKGRKYQC